MPPGRDPFFQRRKEWAKYKHEILERYLRVWVYKLGSRSKLLAFVDTCAGEGTYDDGKPGSPLIAAQYNDSFLNAKGGRLLVIACERSRASIGALRANLAPYIQRQPPQAAVVTGDFNQSLPEILNLTRGVPDTRLH